jgi:hypothetical protein
MTFMENVARGLDGKGPAGPMVVRVMVFLVAISTLAFALSTINELNEQYGDMFTFVEAASVLIFTIDYVLRLITSKSGPLYYIFEPMAIVDLISILPSWMDALIPGDQLPAFQFLRMLRLFKFLSTSKRGSAGLQAFSDSWNDNKSLIFAASIGGGAIWLVTASLEYLSEKENPDMMWCYPPAPVGVTYPILGHSHESEHHESDSHKNQHIMNCLCDGDGCTGSDCVCQSRFKSIPSAMFQVILNLSGEFPLATSYTTFGRIIASITAIMSVAVFAIPTGLVGAAIEDAVGALNSGDEADYDVDDDDVAEIIADFEDNKDDVLKQPVYTKTEFYKKLTGYLIIISTVCSVLGTVKAVRYGLGDDSITAFIMFYAVNVFLCGFFLIEWWFRVMSAGLVTTLKALFSTTINMAHVDLFSWLLDFMFIASTIMSIHHVQAADDKSSEHDPHQSNTSANHTDSGYPMISPGDNVPYFPAYIALTSALFRMIKFERYIHGFKILNRVLDKSQGVLMIGGAAAGVVLIFSSTLMYYAERYNPDPNMSKYYDSVPKAMWVTLLNLSGEAPLSDYTTLGSIIVGTLSITACAIFAIPVGALGSGFEAVISEITSEQEKLHAETDEDAPLLPTTISASSGSAGSGSATEMTKYGSVPTNDKVPESEINNIEKNTKTEDIEPTYTPLQRLVEGMGPRGSRFVFISLCATLYAVSLEVWSTVDYSQMMPKDGHYPKGYSGLIWSHMPSVETNAWLINVSEFLVVAWFTIEYAIRLSANGYDYVFSMYGAIDFVSTFPYYAAKGAFGSNIADVVDLYDGPMRALRILRLVRLDAYVPSLTLIDDAVRNCWTGLSVALFAGAVIWFQFNEILYFTEKDDVEQGEDKRFRNALSSMQYSGVLLTGDYPLVDFSVTGRFACSVAVVVAVGIVAVPASILAGAFVDLLQEQAEKRRSARYEAALKMQTLFLNRKAKTRRASTDSGVTMSAFQATVKDAMKHSAELRGLDAASGEQPFFAKLCIWKNNLRPDENNINNGASSTYFGITGLGFKSFTVKLVFLNIFAVILESVPEIEAMLPHYIGKVLKVFLFYSLL